VRQDPSASRLTWIPLRPREVMGTEGRLTAAA
jgi:hypothetical protein